MSEKIPGVEKGNRRENKKTTPLKAALFASLLAHQPALANQSEADPATAIASEQPSICHVENVTVRNFEPPTSYEAGVVDFAKCLGNNYESLAFYAPGNDGKGTWFRIDDDQSPYAAESTDHGERNIVTVSPLSLALDLRDQVTLHNERNEGAPFIFDILHNHPEPIAHEQAQESFSSIGIDINNLREDDPALYQKVMEIVTSPSQGDVASIGTLSYDIPFRILYGETPQIQGTVVTEYGIWKLVTDPADKSERLENASDVIDSIAALLSEAYTSEDQETRDLLSEIQGVYDIHGVPTDTAIKLVVGAFFTGEPQVADLEDEFRTLVARLDETGDLQLKMTGLQVEDNSIRRSMTYDKRQFALIDVLEEKNSPDEARERIIEYAREAYNVTMEFIKSPTQ